MSLWFCNGNDHGWKFSTDIVTDAYSVVGLQPNGNGINMSLLDRDRYGYGMVCRGEIATPEQVVEGLATESNDGFAILGALARDVAVIAQWQRQFATD